MLFIVCKLEDGFAWRRGAGWAESTTWPQEPNIASFEHVCNQKKPGMGEKITQEAVLGGIDWKLWMTMQLPVFIE